MTAAPRLQNYARPGVSPSSPDGVRPDRRLRVMIVEDCRTVREYLCHAISNDPRLEIVAAVDSGEKALRVLESAAPDVISMDVRLPGIDGLETTRRIMSNRATPIVVVAGNARNAELQILLNALRAGALTVLEKPSLENHQTYAVFAEQLCTQLAIMSQVRVVTRRSPQPPRIRQPGGLRPEIGPGPTRSFDLIGIVASTGGPNAISTILQQLDASFPIPIAIVQHIPASFSKAFTEWLNGIAPLQVTEAQQGELPCPGKVYVAPTDYDLQIRAGRFHLDRGSKPAIHRPSGDALFASMAATLGNRALGVLLTGMGDDGAHGLAALRAAGGLSICEDESTAVVNGMPGAARALGAACESLPLPAISERLSFLARSAVSKE